MSLQPPGFGGREVHIPSHRSLIPTLADGCERGGAWAVWPAFDAIVVPTIRGADTLIEAGRLAAETDCPLLVLCSGHRIDSRRALSVLAEVPGLVRVTAVDYTSSHLSIEAADLLRFRTDEQPEALEGRNNDVSAKRNLALLVARMMGWEALLFLDDDVRDVPEEVRCERGGVLQRTWHALETHPAMEAVGWAFPGAREVGADPLGLSGAPRLSTSDNSMVCHAARLVGIEQDTFIGAGALAVRVGPATPFFPNVYNEDWLFLFDLVVRKAVALAGELTQLPYDPFEPPDTGFRQEFGDVLAEGLFRLLHEHGSLTDAEQVPYWRDVVAMRRALIDWILDRLQVPAARGSSKERATARRVQQRLGVARKRIRAEGLPEALAAYVRAWRQDVDTWSGVMTGLPELDHLDKALVWLGLDPHSR